MDKIEINKEEILTSFDNLRCTTDNLRCTMEKLIDENKMLKQLVQIDPMSRLRAAHIKIDNLPDELDTSLLESPIFHHEEVKPKCHKIVDMVFQNQYKLNQTRLQNEGYMNSFNTRYSIKLLLKNDIMYEDDNGMFYI